MMRVSIALALILATAGCATNPVADDDPGAPSATNGGQSWAAFLSALEPKDELRQVRNNAGRGYAIFRDGRLLSLYLSTIH